jgi:hypothetical protein
LECLALGNFSALKDIRVYWMSFTASLLDGTAPNIRSGGAMVPARRYTWSQSRTTRYEEETGKMWRSPFRGQMCTHAADHCRKATLGFSDQWLVTGTGTLVLYNTTAKAGQVRPEWTDGIII